MCLVLADTCHCNSDDTYFLTSEFFSCLALLSFTYYFFLMQVVDVSLQESSLEFSLVNETDKTIVQKVQLVQYMCDYDLGAMQQKMKERLKYGEHKYC